jgi:hypothetical protein
MYVGRDFDPADAVESSLYTFDFVNEMQDGDTITAATWACAVAAASEGADASPATHVIGSAIFLGTETSQRVSGLLAGVIYVLSATVTTTKGDTLSLWSHVKSGAPA